MSETIKYLLEEKQIPDHWYNIAADLPAAPPPLHPGTNAPLTADDLALRSVVDGIDFSKGKLHATFTGQRMDIQAFSLDGANASTTTGRLEINAGMAEKMMPMVAIRQRPASCERSSRPINRCELAV